MDMEVLATQKQVIPLIRLSEMYLIAIESAPTQNEANALYIPYMKARNVDASPLQQEQLMTEIIREYRREFFGEGQMFYTYKRLGIKNMLWKDRSGSWRTRLYCAITKYRINRKLKSRKL